MINRLKTSTLTIACTFAFLGSGLMNPALANDEYFLYDPQWRFLDDNPAKNTLFGTGRLNLPSFKVDLGTNLPITSIIRDFQSLGTTLGDLSKGLDSGGALDDTATALEKQINNLLLTLDQGLRVDYDINSSVLGFAGSPFPGLKIAGRPLSLGLSIGADSRGYAQLAFSDEFKSDVQDVIGSLPTLLTTSTRVSSISDEANNLISQISRLTGNINDLVELGTELAGDPVAAAGRTEDLARARNLLNDVDLDLSATLDIAKDLNTTVKDILATADSLVSTAQSGSAGGISFSAANDLHLTMNLSAAYPVMENRDFKLSVGTNLKLFVLPYNLPMRQLGINSDLSLLGQLNIDEIKNVRTFTNVEGTLDETKNALEEVDNLIAVSESLSTQVGKLKGLDASNIDDLAQDVDQVITDFESATDSLSSITDTFNNTVNSAGKIQESLLTDLQSARISGSTVTPNGPGFGMDFGVEAQIRENLRLGLMLQNPIVIWPGTYRPFELRFENQAGAFTPIFDIDESKVTSTNYTATVPFAIQMTGQYIFDDLLPNFRGLMANSLFEVVTNGRAPNLTLGLQKQFGPTYIGLGGRLGGVTSMLYAQAGLRQAGPFGLDLMVGIAPAGTGIPFVEALNMANLSMYLQF